jgi:predicted transposase YbfD/YdcC
LGQVKTADHSNEITAIPELLEVLAIKGCTVTIDAIGCQRDIAAAVRAKDAHYVLALKGNQTWLHTRVTQFHEAVTADPERYWRGVPRQTHTTVEKDHGRLETRRYTVVDAGAVLTDRADWTDLATVGWVESERTLLSGSKAGTPEATTREVRFFISSLPPKVGPIAHAVRSHWGIENQCHWTLDVVFQEDQSRVRRDHGPANLATIRRWVLSLLRQDTTHKHGLKARRLNAAWDQDYLLKVLRLAAPPAQEGN